MEPNIDQSFTDLSVHPSKIKARNFEKGGYSKQNKVISIRGKVIDVDANES